MMVATIIEIAVDVHSDRPLGSKNLIQIKLKATRKTAPIKIRSNKFVFMGKKPFLGFLIFATLTP